MEGVISARAEPAGPLLRARWRRSTCQRVSLRRMVSPHDVAAMVAFLLSPMPARNISGQSLGRRRQCRDALRE